jgi:hypothetical protein
MGDYIVLKSNGCTNEYTFQEQVSEKIKEGFIPIGGLTVIPKDIMDRYDESVTFYQAMYREQGAAEC